MVEIAWSRADFKIFAKSLKSIAEQTISPNFANEFIIVNSSDIPIEFFNKFSQKYPWITMKTVPSNINYYRARYEGMKQTTGEILVFCDSDCIYEPIWLGELLKPFNNNPETHIVAGETKIPDGKGPYGLAMAALNFERFTDQKELYPYHVYFNNNVAFSRKILNKFPLEMNLPLYRHQCYIHAQKMRINGYTIWKQPQARSIHALPINLRGVAYRFLINGADYYLMQTYFKDIYFGITKKKKNRYKLKYLIQRIARVLSNHPRYILYLPIGLVFILISQILYFVGKTITAINPTLILKTYTNYTGEAI